MDFLFKIFKRKKALQIKHTKQAARPGDGDVFESTKAALLDEPYYVDAAENAALKQQKNKARFGKFDERMGLAADTETNREILYYLAGHDPDAKVRRAVVENEAMPVQVTPVLAKDADLDVRLALAARLVKLLPDLSEDQTSQLYAYVVQALGTLALDEVLKVRKALTATLKDNAFTPPKVAARLARDIERDVSEPILQACAALSDEDLLSILLEHPSAWAARAIAGRAEVSTDVSQAIINHDDIQKSGLILIKNEGAIISLESLNEIVERSRTWPEWQKPIAMRKGLPVSIARDLAGFVDQSVADVLIGRSDFDQETIEDISAIVRRRIDFVNDRDLAKAKSDTDEKKTYDKSDVTKARLAQMLEEGRIGEDTISDALAMRDYDFVCEALGLLCRTDVNTIRSVFDSSSSRSVVAIAWKAGLTMRLALQLQKDMAHIQPAKLIYPKEGHLYPMDDDDILWQLEFIGI